MAKFIGFRDGVALDFEMGSSLPFFIFANFFFHKRPTKNDRRKNVKIREVTIFLKEKLITWTNMSSRDSLSCVLNFKKNRPWLAGRPKQHGYMKILYAKTIQRDHHSMVFGKTRGKRNGNRHLSRNSSLLLTDKRSRNPANFHCSIFPTPRSA